VEIGSAWERLGLDPATTLADVRKRYRALLLVNHPDQQSDARVAGLDSDRTTRELIAAFRAIEASFETAELFDVDERDDYQIPDLGGNGVAHAGPEPSVDDSDSETDVRVVERDTLSVCGPSDQVFGRLLEAGAMIGEITYLDRQNELFESLLKTVDGDALSLVCTLQGRADETTEAFFTMEPLGIARHPLPNLADIVELVAFHVRAQRW
jgi:curved DNA-binding protein CbpA